MNDDELKQRFGELKRSDAAKAPTFEALTAKRPRARVPFVIAIVPVFAAAAVFLLWCGAGSMAKRAAPVGAAAAAAPEIRVQAAAALPLDFLLENAPVGVNLDADPLRGLQP